MISKEEVFLSIAYTALVLSICLMVGLGFFAITKNYKVWAFRKDGQAELAQAESNRSIKVLEAEAKKEAAKFLADAECIRAKGVAEANKIIGDSLKDNESYLRYLWIDNLGNSISQVIYVPTEANLPILEAGKRSQVQ